MEKKAAPKAAFALVAALVIAAAGFAAFKALAPAGGGGGGPVVLPADLTRERVFLLSKDDRVRGEVDERSRAVYRVTAWASEGRGEVEWLSGATVLASSSLDGSRRALDLPLRPGLEQALTVRVRAGAAGVRVEAVSSVGRLRTGVLAQGASEDWVAAFKGSGG